MDWLNWTHQYCTVSGVLLSDCVAYLRRTRSALLTRGVKRHLRTSTRVSQVETMARVLALVLSVLLTETLSATLLSPGTERASPCPPRWHQFGQRCFAFYPVWSSWYAAKSLCSQAGHHLASPHIPEELRFVSQLANTATAVWLDGSHKQQNWSNSSDVRVGDWTNQMAGKACMQMDPKSGELGSAACEELRFYVCSTNTSSSEVFAKNSDRVQSQMVPNVSLFDVMWGESDRLAVEILHSSSFLKELCSGQLTEGCHACFMQQEALYLHTVSSMLEVLLGSLQEADDMRPLLMDTLKHYSSRNQRLLDSPPPLWLQLSLRSFHSVVLEEPVYWVVALLARASLRNFLAEELQMSEVKASSFYQEWSDESLKEFAWTQRYRKAIEEHQDQMDVFKAINIFRDHMMNQKSFYKAVNCYVGVTFQRGGVKMKGLSKQDLLSTRIKGHFYRFARGHQTSRQEE